tara:strand:+ start:2307 stop:2804 length:498 start_codon:yes stop_codon:yes gene_type:complete
MDSNIINADSRLVLKSLRLSSNPAKPVVDMEDGVSGKINMTSDGRGYFIAEFQDPTNPFAVTRSRVMQQQKDSVGNAVWRGPSPRDLMSWVGKQLPGEFVSRQVEPYSIGDSTATSYTTVVLKNEMINTIFRQSGHEVLTNGAIDTPSTVVVEDVPIPADAETAF